MTKAKLTAEQKALAEENLRLVYFMARKLQNKTPMDMEDIVSACMEGLVKSVQTFNPDYGIKFSTYASKVMANCVFKENRRIGKHESVLYLEDLSIRGEENNTDWQDLISSPICQENQLLIRDALERAIHRASTLSLLSRKVLHVFLSDPDLTQMEIAELTGTTQANTSRIIKKYRRLLHKELAV